MKVAGGPEADLLLCCARRALNSARRERILALLAGPLDWRRFMELASAHGLLPLAHAHLDGLAAQGVPRPVQVELWGRHEANLRRNRALARELLCILDGFESQAIAAIAYKGPALAASVYGDVALREFGDLDILVRPRDVPGAKARLEAQGYVDAYPLAPAVEEAFLRSSVQYHLVLVNAARAAIVELHWKTDPDFPVERDDDDWWAWLGSTGLEGARVRAFSNPELLLALCVHGSKHRWSSLGWLVDVAELIRQDPALDWAWILARAADLRCERRLALGLRLASGVLEAPLPEDARAWIASRPEVEPIAAAIAATFFDLDALKIGPLTLLRRNLELYDTARQRIAHCVNVIWAPSLVEWSRWPLPRGLFFLYPFLRIARLTLKYATAASRGRPGGAAEPHLPPRLEHHDGNRVGQVEAAIARPHRQP